ncbi:S1 family peptidase [Amycolatopsis jiangsuensis]|uniref:Secreted trypsin-like serine protease n=1 Tax=Amycolatopsis jiangsuensis TaxID=1181879 RepID=A0A840IZR6_9PSEU|nr:trypsin-like serine protease [Amycolatopsis jiangsuensis]MBB4687173.1 secreted trypsin-like serine protease [Amycolatopsis jiangsuensis]
MRVRAAITAATLLTALTTSTTLTAGPALAVAGGSDVAPGQYGFTAKLAMTGIPRPDGSTYASFCSGALVAPGWIITTGHCFHDANRARVSGPVPYPTTVTLGLVDEAKEKGVTRKVTQVLQAGPNDVALAQLDSPVTEVTPLTVNKLVPGAGQRLTLAGWGSLTATNPTPSTKLQQGEVQISSVSATTATVHGVSPAASTSACAYDSGAPYFVPSGSGGQLISVETNGPDCPHTSPETTSRVDVLADWIAEHAK